MNNVFNNLITSLSEEFKKHELDEKIQLSLSKIEGYDLQINNLVKYNKSDLFNELQENIIELINNSKIFLPVEKNDIGFLNLSFNHIYLMKNITNTRIDFENKHNSKIIFDYGGPNIGKPLHVGHMRTLNIGRSLYNIHSFIGNEVVSDIHLGDWGMPIAQIIAFLEKGDIQMSRKGNNRGGNPSKSNKAMKYMVDIDNTICYNENSNYEDSKPDHVRIAKLNELFDKGHEIHYWTARGTSTKEYEKKFEKKKVSRPPYWVGIKITPTCFEFWQGNQFRLHEREVYNLKQKVWQKKILSP